MIVEVAVYHHPDGSRSIGHPDPRHGVRLGRIAMALSVGDFTPDPSSELRTKRPCDCLSCQTGRPDYPCLIEEDQ